MDPADEKNLNVIFPACYQWKGVMDSSCSIALHNLNCTPVLKL